MRITGVGAILIVAATIAAVLLVRLLTDDRNRGPQQNDTSLARPG
jgi:hypothetical protein